MGKDQVNDAADDIGKKVENASESMFGDAKAKVDGVVDQVTETAQNAYGSAKESVQQAASDVPRFVEDAWDSGRRSYRQGSQAVREQFNNVPFTELLLAGAAGYFLAWLIHSRR